MIHKNLGAIPERGVLTDADHGLLAATEAGFAGVGDLLAGHRQKHAITEAMRVVGEANKYLSDQAPWKLRTSEPERYATVLHVAAQAVTNCRTLLSPFLPHSSQAVHEALGVPRMVQIGCDLEGARWTVELLDTSVAAGAIVGGVALHPTEATKLGPDLESAMSQIEKLARHPRVRVVGETGLDHYWVPADDVPGRAAQEASFRRHIDLAKRLGKVLQIHDRDAHADVLRIPPQQCAP